MSPTRFFDSLLRMLGMRTLNQQFLFSYALMFVLAVTASVALYLSMSVSPETINVAGAQRMLSQKMTKEALLLRQGASRRAALDATIAQFDQAHRDLLAGNPARNVSVIRSPPQLPPPSLPIVVVDCGSWYSKPPGTWLSAS